MCLNPVYLTNGNVVRCGKCIECKIQYSEDWAYRVMLEAKKYEHNCFITLTYNEDNLPTAGVCKRSAQLFIKSLRKALEPLRIRYFLCGEYGEKFLRPHYHAIIFNYDFEDKKFFKFDNKGNPLYRSALLESIWKYGFSSVGEELTFDSAKYCAKYMQADKRKFEELGLEPPFVLMSRRPGLALDVVPDTVGKYGQIYYQGQVKPAPQAFIRKANELKPVEDLFDIDKETGEVTKKRHIWKPFESMSNVWNRIFRRREKYIKIFGETLDKDYRVNVLLKRRGTVRKK